MDILAAYLAGRLASLPPSSANETSKAELLAQMTARYQELLAAGVNDAEALGTVINEYEAFVTTTAAHPAENQLTHSEVETFWRSSSQLAWGIAGGVLSIVLGFGAFTFFIKTPLNWLGLLLMIIGLIIGVGALITTGIAYIRVKNNLDQKVITADIQAVARQQHQDNTTSFTLYLVGGVSLCLLAFFPLILQAVWQSATFERIGIAAFIWMLGCGIFAIIYGSIIEASYTKIARSTVFTAINPQDEDAEQLQRLKQQRPKLFFVLYHVYWPLIILFYLMLSFILGYWSLTWLIFPVAGILFAILRSYAVTVPKKP